MLFYVYILECSDNSLYTGATSDVAKRVLQHNNTKAGAKYTKARRPVELRHVETFQTFKESRTREAEIKRMDRQGKLSLIKDASAKVKVKKKSKKIT